MEGFEVERDFPRIGRRAMLLNARKVFYEGNGHTTILLGFEDATERRRTERALQKLLEQKEMLLSEMSHRVANSLQIIASILLMKARTVGSARSGATASRMTPAMPPTPVQRSNAAAAWAISISDPLAARSPRLRAVRRSSVSAGT